MFYMIFFSFFAGFAGKGHTAQSQKVFVICQDCTPNTTTEKLVSSHLGMDCALRAENQTGRGDLPPGKIDVDGDYTIDNNGAGITEGYGPDFASAMRMARRICLRIRGVFSGQCVIEKCTDDAKAAGDCTADKTVQGRTKTTEDQNIINSLVCDRRDV